MQKSSSLNSVSFKLKSSLTDSISQSCLFPLATHSISPSLRSLHHFFPLPISLYLSLTITRQQLSLCLFQESRNPKTQREKHQQTPLPPPGFNRCHLQEPSLLPSAFDLFGLFFLSLWFRFDFMGFCLGFWLWVRDEFAMECNRKRHGWEIKSIRFNFNLNEIEFYKLDFYAMILKLSSMNLT